jgi:prophage regulatory protein
VKPERKISRKGELAARRIIRRPEVEGRTGYSGTTIWRKERDGQFPKRVQLSSDGMAVGWYEDEVDDWIQSRIRKPGKRPLSAKRAREAKVASRQVTGVGKPEAPTGAPGPACGPEPETPVPGKTGTAPPKRGRGARAGDWA